MLKTPVFFNFPWGIKRDIAPVIKFVGPKSLYLEAEDTITSYNFTWGKKCQNLKILRLHKKHIGVIAEYADFPVPFFFR
tara:strand:+ start:437 stop:673 length:237 start_codon:yes stop_codon:yes gene_type:complete